MGEEREEGRETKGKKSGNPAHYSPVSMLRRTAFLLRAMGSHGRLLSREVACSNGHVCAKGCGNVEAG